MYKFYHGTLKPTFPGDALRLIMTDTDSLMLYITHPDVWGKLHELLPHLDMHTYPNNHRIWGDSIAFKIMNRKVVGMFKDESGGNAILEAIALRSKMYSYITKDDNVKKAKGVPKAAVHHHLRHSDYRECLINTEGKSVPTTAIRHFKHDVYTVKSSKLALSPYDDKRMILETNPKDTVAFGYVGDLEEFFKVRMHKFL